MAMVLEFLGRAQPGIPYQGSCCTSSDHPFRGIYALSQGKFFIVLKKSMIPVGVVIFLILNFWYIVVYQKLGNEFIHEFFINQIFKRGTKSLVGHAGIPFYYFLIIILFTYPFFPSSLSGFIDAAERWFKGKLCTPLERLVFFSAIAVATVVAVFTIAATKLPHYILPAVPFLGILSGYYLSLVFNRTKASKYRNPRIPGPAHCAFTWFYRCCRSPLFQAAGVLGIYQQESCP